MLQSITERVLAAAVVLCIVISGALWIALKAENARYTVAAAQLEQAQRDTEQARKERDAQVAALNKLKTQLDKLRSDEASAKGKLNEALNSNADWAMLSFLTACSTPSLQSLPLQSLPADSLLADCQRAEKPATKTNSALADYALRERYALERCNADKAALRVWKEGQMK